MQRAKKVSAALDAYPQANAPHFVGYARVSMADQNNRRQVDDLLKAGVDARDIYTDNASGKTSDRPGWQACLRDLQPGDVLVFASIDRLGRDMGDLVLLARDLRERGIGMKALNMDIDTTTPNGELVYHILAGLAQWERRLIVERTKSGLMAAKARGKVGGAKPKASDAQVLDAHALVRNGMDGKEAAARIGLTRGGLYKAFLRLKREGKIK